MTEFADKISAWCDRIEKNNIWRQKKCFNLIPSENTPSLLVKLAEIADPSGRYAEHRTMKGQEVYFYQGTDFIRDVELEARKELSRYFGCTDVELRPVSGQMANEVVFKGLVKFVNRKRAAGQPFRRLRLVMNNDLNKGGHLSSQPMGALFNLVEEDPASGKENVVNIPVRRDNPYRADLDRLAELLKKHRPELVVFGKSMFIYREPVSFVYDLVKDWPDRPVLMYDMAHVLGLYGAFQAPFAEGADLVTGSTHKTFFGTQRGLVAGNFSADSPFKQLWTDIQGRAFPGSTSNHHLGTLLGLLLSAIEMNEFKEEYQAQVCRNARAFARYLKAAGIPVEGEEADGFTETHQVLIRVKQFGNGQEIARRLEDNNLLTNYQALPDDATFLDSSGIRMGVQEMTRFGMKEKDFEVLAGLIAEVIIRNKKVGEEVSRYRRNFLEMRYCLPEKQALELAGRLLLSLLPSPALAAGLAENMARRARELSA
ncbi:MAG: Serine hydroxymethyltransferase [Candidatus Saccharicenans subterraneus]|uniref:Serine hydroxymethyltransferase n=1 Tax=Candidatus Saccharicenans subterraneus TaxID=2508984 RepID=A0A3E2BNI3_9BACT|nr:MAG: Serine hydroxymethyltransferase [Candidatus Saccharicenans subterraneum]